ncbi:MAG: hypothetical protein V1698_02595 [bacterium]
MNFFGVIKPKKIQNFVEKCIWQHAHHIAPTEKAEHLQDYKKSFII